METDSKPTQADDGGARERGANPVDRDAVFTREDQAGYWDGFRDASKMAVEVIAKVEQGERNAPAPAPTPSEPGEEGNTVTLRLPEGAILGDVLDGGTMKARITATGMLRWKDHDYLEGLLTLAALAPKAEPVAEYQWRSTKHGTGKWWNGSKEEVESHGKVGCETRELFTRPTPSSKTNVVLVGGGHPEERIKPVGEPIEPGAAREALHNLVAMLQTVGLETAEELRGWKAYTDAIKCLASQPAAQGEETYRERYAKDLESLDTGGGE